MGSSKKQTVGYRYFMGLHFGVCQGPVDSLLRILIGDRVAWSGQQTANGSISINAPDLFGGEEREGGVQGTLDVMMGGATQGPNSYLAGAQGGQQPSYRGLLSAVFRRGFVGANNPYVKPWAFTVTRILAGWYGGSAWYPDKAAVGSIGSSVDSTLVQSTFTSGPASQPWDDLSFYDSPVSGATGNVIDGTGFVLNSATSTEQIITYNGPSPDGVRPVTFEGFAQVVSNPNVSYTRMIEIQVNGQVNRLGIYGSTPRVLYENGAGGGIEYGDSGSGILWGLSRVHWCLQFTATHIYVHINGVKVHEQASVGLPSASNAITVLIGGSGYSGDGTPANYIVDSFRVVNEAVYGSANFTPPAGLPVPDSPATIETQLIADTSIPGTAARTSSTGGLTVGGLDPSDILILRRIPTGATYGSFSEFDADGLGPGGLAWTNLFYVTKADGTTVTSPGTRYATEAAAVAAGAGYKMVVTGSTSYTIWLGDPNPADNRGGLSLSVSVARAKFAMNPAHIVYQCLTDPEWGMGYSSTIINDANFRAAADTFHDEGMGLCLHWTQQQPIEAFIQTVMDHAGAVLRQDPRTGLFEIKPLRADYVVGSLPLFDESNIRAVDSFERAGATGSVNEVTVRYDDYETGKQGSVTVQNLAAVTSSGGTESQSVPYPGLPTAALAARVAMRDLRALSTPLSRTRMRVNRSGYSVLPGDVVRMAWPKLGITQLVLRVARVNAGALTDGMIDIEAAEDVFGLGASTYVAQQPPGWQEPSTQPQPVTTRAVIESPYYELQRELSAADLAALPSDAGYLLAGAVRPNGAALNFRIATRPAGSGGYEEAGTGDFCAAGTLAGALNYTATAATLATVSGEGLIEVGSYALIDQEIVRVDAYDSGTNALTLGRGVLDTVAATHATGATVFFLGAVNASDNVERVDGESIDVKLLTAAGGGTVAESATTADTLTFEGRAARPYPPGRVRVNGLAYPASVDSPVFVSWAHRNRLQQNLEGDESGDIGPEAGTTYSARLLEATTETLVSSASGATGTGVEVLPTPPAGSYLLEVWSARAGLESLQRHRFPLVVLGAAYDTSFADVVLLLRGDGTDNSTTIIDSSSAARAMTAVGDARIRTSELKYGVGSIAFDGTGDSVSTPNSTDFDFGTGDLTIESWVFIAANSATDIDGQRGASVCNAWASGGTVSGWAFNIVGSSSATGTGLAFDTWSSTPGNGTLFRASATLAQGVWHHVAAVVSGGVRRLFLNGALLSGSTNTIGAGSPAAQTHGNALTVGRTPTTAYPLGLNGYIDELRITKGVARYTAAFTPPAGPFPVGQGQQDNDGELAGSVFYNVASVGSEIVGIRADSTTGLGDALLRIHPQTFAQINGNSVGGTGFEATQLASDGTAVFVSVNGAAASSKVYRFALSDINSGGLPSTLHDFGASNPAGGVTFGGGAVWAADYNGNLVRLNATTLALLNTYAIGPGGAGNGFEGLFFDAAGTGHLFAPQPSQNRTLQINPADGSVVQTFTASSGSSPGCALVRGDLLFTLGHGSSGALNVHRVSTGALLRTDTTTFMPRRYRYALADLGSFILAVRSSAGALVFLDPLTGEQVSTQTITGATAASGFAFSRFFVTRTRAGTARNVARIPGAFLRASASLIAGAATS